MEKYCKPLLCVLIALLVSSCNNIPNSLPGVSPTPRFASPSLTSTITPLASPTLTATNPPSPTANAVLPVPTWIIDIHPSLSSAFYSTNPVTDGKLEVSTGSFDTLCFHPGELVYFQTIFKNVSDEDIKLVDFNYPSRKETANAYGQIYPILTTLDGKEIYPDTYFSQDAAINPRSPFISLIHPDVILVVGEGYQIPKNIGVEDKDHNVTFQPLSSGKYLLKFVYTSIGYDDSWKGIISSNQIEVCVVE